MYLNAPNGGIRDRSLTTPTPARKGNRSVAVDLTGTCFNLAQLPRFRQNAMDFSLLFVLTPYSSGRPRSKRRTTGAFSVGCALKNAPCFSPETRPRENGASSRTHPTKIRACELRRTQRDRLKIQPTFPGGNRDVIPDDSSVTANRQTVSFPERTVMPIGMGTRPHENGEFGWIGRFCRGYFQRKPKFRFRSLCHRVGDFVRLHGPSTR